MCSWLSMSSRTISPLVLCLSVSVAACGKGPTAMDVCHRLESAGVAANCRGGTPNGLGAAAVEDAEFDLSSVPEHGGAVLRFDTDEAYDRTVDSFSKAAALAGPHRYGSRKTRIFVQMNEGASSAVGAQAKAVVDALPEVFSGPPLKTSVAASTTPSATAPASTPSAAAHPAVSALEVCQKLATAGVAKSCKGENPVTFNIASAPARRGEVVALPDDRAYAKYATGVASTPQLAEAGSFGSPNARVFVHLLGKPPQPADASAKAKAVVDAL